MYPLLFSVGPLPIYGYGVMLALAFSLGVLAMLRQGREAGLPEEKLLNLIIIIFFSAMAGSRLAYILAWEMQAVLHKPMLAFHFGSGLSFHGGFFLAVLAGVWYGRAARLPLGKLADMAAPSIALGYGITRIGCFLRGCCYGRVTQVAWALPVSLQDPVLRHPTQLYSLLAGLLIYIILKGLQRRCHSFPGFLLLALAVQYSIYRFILEFFRQEDVLFFRVLTMGQAVSIFMLVLSLALIYWWGKGGWGRGDEEKGFS